MREAPERRPIEGEKLADMGTRGCAARDGGTAWKRRQPDAVGTDGVA